MNTVSIRGIDEYLDDYIMKTITSCRETGVQRNGV